MKHTIFRNTRSFCSFRAFVLVVGSQFVIKCLDIFSPLNREHRTSCTFSNYSLSDLQGLCGTFNGNQKDDFLTPEGDVEQDAVAFANKWKTREVCDNSEVSVSHPCDKHVGRRKLAESHCANITSSLFAG